MKKLSVVVGVYNEEGTVGAFYEKTSGVLNSLGFDWEIIYINDGSVDGTRAKLKEIALADDRVKVVHFSRNFGQQAGFLCGLKYASGDAVVTIDVDLQDPPELIAEMVEKWRQGYEIVHTRRRTRAGETAFKKTSAKCFYHFSKKITGLDIPRDAGNFKLCDRKVVDAVLSLGGHDRFWGSESVWVGFKSTVVEFDRHARVAGTTKYNVKKLVKLAGDGILPNTDKPLKFFLKLGVLGCALSVLCFITFIVLACLGVEFGGLIAWLFPTVALLASVSLVSRGVSDIYLYMAYREGQGRPNYIVSEKWNMDE